MSRWLRRGAGVALATLAAAGCSRSGGGPIVSRSDKPAPTAAPAPPPINVAVLTADGADAYAFAPVGRRGVSIVAPPTDRGTNLRVVFWWVSAPVGRDLEVCDTWEPGAYPLAQQGVALRIRADGRVTRAITVSKNIYGMTVFSFNVHVWDSSRGLQQPVGDVDLRAALDPAGTLVPLPWRMCARAIGDRVDVKVWPAQVVEPGWDDARYSGSVSLPTGWLDPGAAGWYAAHIPPAGSMGYSDLTATAVTGG